MTSANSSLTLAVVGANFPNKRGPTRRFAINLCRPGDLVQLVREPKNPADPRAIQVQSAEGLVMGYLTAERCGLIGQQMARGRTVNAIFQEATEYGALIRVAYDAIPILPPNSAAPNRNRDWWPDEIPPD